MIRLSPGAVAEVAVVQLQALGTGAEALAQMIDSSGGETRSAPHHPMHFAALFQKRLGEVRAILSGNAGYQCYFGHLSLGLYRV